MSTPNTIELDDRGRHEEYTVDAADYVPGLLMEITATGIKPHATAGGVAERMFLKEDALQGNTIADAYAADAVGMVVIAPAGDRIYAMVASGEVVAVNDKLISNGAGKLIVATGTVLDHLAVALEAATELAADTKLIVRVI